MIKIMIGMVAYRGLQCIPCLNSIEATTKLLMENGYHVSFKMIEDSPYVQTARNELLRLFMAENHDIFFSIDDDISFPAETVLEFLNKNDEFLSGVYPKKTIPQSWPVVIHTDAKGYPQVRSDGYISACRVPAGFFCLKRSVVETMYKHYEFRTYYDLQDDETEVKTYDLFPQGLNRVNIISDFIDPIKSSGKWIGEDFAFCDLWRGVLGQIWIKPDITFSHWKFKHNEYVEYKGNYHEYLLTLPKE